jgi:hypothetical protein
MDPIDPADVDGYATRTDERSTAVAAARMREARSRCVQVPREIIQSFGAARAGEGELEAFVGLFSAPLTGGQRWTIIPPRGTQLTLPLVNASPEHFAVAARDALPGSMLRTYLATWALWAKAGGAATGAFERDDRVILSELFGVAGMADRGSLRMSPTRLAELSADFDRLEGIFIKTASIKTGDSPDLSVSVSSPEPLLQRITARAGTREKRVYAHARPMVLLAHRVYVQVPSPVLRLNARDIPIAMALAEFWRDRTVPDILNGPGHSRLRLRQLLARLAVDVKAAVRRDGHTFWIRQAASLARIANAGDLGTLHVEGEGPSAIVTLTPSVTLGLAYHALAERQRERRAAARLAEPMKAALAALPARGGGRKR